MGLKQTRVRLRAKLRRQIRAIIPKCNRCGKDDIQLKTSSHEVVSWNGVIGPGSRGPSSSTDVDGLYCESCAEFYFNTRILALGEVLEEISAIEGEIRTSQNQRPLNRTRFGE